MLIYKKLYNRYFILVNKLRIKNLKFLGAKVGNNVCSYGRFTIMNVPNLEIGDNTTINEGVHINCRDKVKIGTSVRLSTNTQIHTGKLLVDVLPRVHDKAPVVIEDNVWIASNCVISAGVHIGKNSIIGAGSVVTKDIPANCFVGGVPAKIIKALDIIDIDKENKK